MKRVFMVGMFVTSCVLLGIIPVAIYKANTADEIAGPKLQWVYQVMVNPATGGPTFICATLPVAVDSTLVQIQDIRSTQPVYVSTAVSLFIVPSDKPVNVEELRRKLLEPVFETQEAVGPLPPAEGGNG